MTWTPPPLDVFHRPGASTDTCRVYVDWLARRQCGEPTCGVDTPVPMCATHLDRWGYDDGSSMVMLDTANPLGSPAEAALRE